MPQFAFDLKLTTALRIDAPTEKAARKLLAGLLDCADANLGAFPNGDPILAEVSLEPDTLDLYEIDGETPHVSTRVYGGEVLFADGDRFRIFEEPAHGYRIARLSDGAEATFHGDDSCERFRDNFTGDEMGTEDPADQSAEADEFGEWCEANGELSPILAPVNWEAVARRHGWLEVNDGGKRYLSHRNLDRVWPLDDWEGAARDLGIGDDGTYGDESAAA